MSNLEYCYVEKELEFIPCGQSITSIYIAENGEMVRQDVEIKVSEGFLLGSQANLACSSHTEIIHNPFKEE